MADVFFSIGSNQGDRSANLRAAIAKLEEKVGTLTGKSSLYESEPWGYSDQNQYLNQVLRINSKLMPLEVLKIALNIETKLGRVRSEWQGYEGRTMDIDLLFYDNLEVHTKSLTIPHPKMHLRNFGLVPLAEIVPEIIHPVFRRTILELRDNCNDKAQLKIFKEV